MWLLSFSSSPSDLNLTLELHERFAWFSWHVGCMSDKVSKGFLCSFFIFPHRSERLCSYMLFMFQESTTKTHVSHVSKIHHQDSCIIMAVCSSTVYLFLTMSYTLTPASVLFCPRNGDPPCLSRCSLCGCACHLFADIRSCCASQCGCTCSAYLCNIATGLLQRWLANGAAAANCATLDRIHEPTVQRCAQNLLGHSRSRHTASLRVRRPWCQRASSSADAPARRVLLLQHPLSGQLCSSLARAVGALHHRAFTPSSPCAPHSCWSSAYLSDVSMPPCCCAVPALSDHGRASAQSVFEGACPQGLRSQAHRGMDGRLTPSMDHRRGFEHSKMESRTTRSGWERRRLRCCRC